MKHPIPLLLALVSMILAPTIAFAQTTTVHNGDLIKGSGSAVYYLYDGQRLVFPNEKTYKTWYSDYSGVKTISDAELMSYQLKANVTYKPGTRLIKITTDPRVYAVDTGGTLRPIANEAVAKSIFGNNWSALVDDVSDAFFVNYSVGTLIDTNRSFSPDAISSRASSISEDRVYIEPSHATISSDPLKFLTTGLSVSINKTISSGYPLTLMDLQGAGSECGHKQSDDRYNTIIDQLAQARVVRYDITSNQLSSDPTYTLFAIQNTPKYATLDAVKQDLDICAAGGRYPILMNADWIILGSSCGGAGDENDPTPLCSSIQKVVSPSLQIQSNTSM